MQYPSAAAVIWNQDLEMFLLPCLALEMVRCENHCDPLYLESLNLGGFFIVFNLLVLFYICIFQVYLKSIHGIVFVIIF